MSRPVDWLAGCLFVGRDRQFFYEDYKEGAVIDLCGKVYVEWGIGARWECTSGEMGSRNDGWGSYKSIYMNGNWG